MPKNEDSSFEALQAKWYAKLARKGFKDIEDANGNLKDMGKPLLSGKEEYYRQITNHLHYTDWDHKADKLIMKLHSDGMMIKDIVQAIKVKRWPMNRNTVALVIRKYEALWGIRKWTHIKS